MPTFDLRFAPEIRFALEKLAVGFDDTLTHPVARRAAIPADADEDLAGLWHDSLLSGLDADMASLRALLAQPHFGDGPVTLSDDDALSTLRGFTVLRLALRHGVLRDIPDAELESGIVDRRRLSPGARHGYACYGALGEIQAALCETLDD